MGSDLSKPKNKKHHKNDFSDLGNVGSSKRNSRTICYDLPDCYDPCSQSVKFAPLPLPPMPPQRPVQQQQQHARYPRDPCREACRELYKDYDNDRSEHYDRSNIVSHLQLSPRSTTRKLICYECPEQQKNSSSSSHNRAPRYKTTKPSIKREDTFMDDSEYRSSSKDQRRYTVVNSSSSQPYHYSESNSNNKNNSNSIKLTDDYDGIPKERIYEIRKEKILIKADKSPERYRSKSSEKYLDSRTTADHHHHHKSYDDGGGAYKVYERDDNATNQANNTRKQLQSRSVYVLKDDRESSPERHDNNHNHHQQQHYKSNNNVKISSNCSSNQTSSSSQQPPIAAVASSTLSDIVYVPMVKEDFLKRECKKLNETTTTTSINNNSTNQEQTSIKKMHSLSTNLKSTSTNTTNDFQQKPHHSILSTTSRTYHHHHHTTASSSMSAANSPSLACSASSPYSKPRLFKKVIISEAFPQNYGGGSGSNNDSDENLTSTAKQIPINFENNLLKIKINQPGGSESKTTNPAAVASNCPQQQQQTITSTEFNTPNLTVRKGLKNNIEISTNSSLPVNNNSNLINEIKINLNKSNKKTGVVYSRYIYTGNTNNNDMQSETNTETNYDSLTEDNNNNNNNNNNSSKSQQKLRETSYELNDLIEDKNTTECSSSKIIGFHRF